jgi:hypothetical protein
MIYVIQLGRYKRHCFLFLCNSSVLLLGFQMEHNNSLEGLQGHFSSVILLQLEQFVSQLVGEGRDHIALQPNPNEGGISFYHRLIDHTPLFHVAVKERSFRVVFPPNLHFVVSRHFMMEKGGDNRCFVDLPVNTPIPKDEIQSWISQSLAYLL